MRMYQNTFIGPAIKCERPTQTSNHLGTRCSDITCVNYGKESMGADFCPKCGAKVETHLIPEPMGMFQILEKEGVDDNQFFVIHEDMCELDDGLTVLTDNTKHYGTKNGVLTAKDINEALADFIERFKSEIPALKKYYESVLVEYMVFTYYN